jgi:hypothetical protein
MNTIGGCFIHEGEDGKNEDGAMNDTPGSLTEMLMNARTTSPSSSKQCSAPPFIAPLDSVHSVR